MFGAFDQNECDITQRGIKNDLFLNIFTPQSKCLLRSMRAGDRKLSASPKFNATKRYAHMNMTDNKRT